MTTEDFISKAIGVHGNKYDYLKVEYVNAVTKVTIICPIHGEFRQNPHQHLQGKRCQRCSNNIRRTTEEFIAAAREVHGDKYNYSKVEYVNHKTPVIIICPLHGEFEQYPNDHIYKGCGCPYCGGSAKHTTEQFIATAREVHGNKYDYSKVDYVNSYTKVLIICPIHGAFEQVPSNHLIGQGCPKCSKNRKHTTEEFIATAKEIHGDKYDYSKVKYINNQTHVTIICPTHGEFEQRPNAHLRGHGCPYCGGSARLTTEQFIDIAREVHGDKYNYSKVEYINMTTNVTIICPIHGEFEQNPHGHLRGQGCPICKSSKLEEDVIQKLKQKNIQYTVEQTFEWLIRKSYMRLDIYLPKYNAAIECHGIQHFYPIEFFGGEEQLKDNQNRDRNKHDLCEANGVKIFYYSKYEIDDYELGRVYNDVDELLNVIINEA